MICAERSGIDYRCQLFYGPDEAGSRALAAAAARQLGNEERIDLSPAQLKADPALLADEAAASSLFGGPRYIRVDGVGDESLAAVEALFALPVAGNPVLLVGGALKKDSRLVKRIAGDALGRAVVSYVPDLRDLARIAMALGRDLGLTIQDNVAQRLAMACGGDRAILQREIEKLADFADASPATPRVVSDQMIDAIGADSGEGDVGAVVDALCRGDPRQLDLALQRVAGDSQEIALLRALLRRLLAMTAVRAEIDRGRPVKAALDVSTRSLFWRDRETVGRDIGRWSAGRLARAIERTTELERAAKSSYGPGVVAIGQRLHAIARSIAR